MVKHDVERLKAIRTFPSLVKYLRDDMNWPIDTDDFEDLTFDYEPDELGIDKKTAAKIEEIKQLRPLSTDQPWGIFFVKFEPKRLPVVALRRVLSGLVIKKRSTLSFEQAAWNLHDLLFISNYGDADERKITFAHFSEASENGDLPTLKVLGWDGDDTNLHIDDVADKLTSKLCWPVDVNDAETWRSTWSSAFTLQNREVITTSKRMAERLAELARSIRKKVESALAIETEKGPLRKLMKAFQQSLIHDLNEGDFADMYAQTIAYGLLSASVSRESGGLVADDAALMVPVTNPFLRELMETFIQMGGRRRSGQKSTGIDFDELGINEVVQMLRDANMEAVVLDFGDKNPLEDPVIHFYELFLKEYDAKKRMQRGVFYTPKPVVSYIVRSVHELLQTEFDLPDGLADTATWGEMAERHEGLSIPDGVKPTDRFVTILDPATGTGTFLVECIDLIYKTMVEKWELTGCRKEEITDLWNDYVPKHLLPRLHGYELLMAPYAIAHLKIGLKLHETGYRFASNERARIYLTNALEPASNTGQRMLEGMLPALAHEAIAVNEVKCSNKFTIVIGNPPYSFRSTNKSTFIMNLLQEYRKGLNEQKPQLNDDYVKFIRLGQHVLENQPLAILGMITNNSYLYGITHRRMRESLCESFSSIRIIDLGGDVKFQDPQHSDENVFDIQQGVCIGIYINSLSPSNKIVYSRLKDTRTDKYQILSNSKSTQLSFELLKKQPPYYFTNYLFTIENDYMAWPSITDVFPSYINGVVTSRDEFCVDTSIMNLKARLEDYATLNINDLLKKYEALDLRDNISVGIKTAQHNLNLFPNIIDDCITKCAFRPFDVRYLAYDRNYIHRTREKVMKHLLPLLSKIN